MGKFVSIVPYEEAAAESVRADQPWVGRATQANSHRVGPRHHEAFFVAKSGAIIASARPIQTHHYSLIKPVSLCSLTKQKFR